MSSPTAICNLALALLGATSIENLDDTDGKEARLCKAFYEPSRDQMFEEFPWTFTKKRANLNRLEETPAFEYDFYYALPTDYISPRYIDKDEGVQWSLEDGKIACSETVLELVYSFCQKDVSKMSPTSIIALSQLIASNIAPGIIQGKNTVSAQMYQLYLATVARSQQLDAFKGNEYPADQNNPNKDAWVTGRQS